MQGYACTTISYCLLYIILHSYILYCDNNHVFSEISIKFQIITDIYYCSCMDVGVYGTEYKMIVKVWYATVQIQYAFGELFHKCDSLYSYHAPKHVFLYKHELNLNHIGIRRTFRCDDLIIENHPPGRALSKKNNTFESYSSAIPFNRIGLFKKVMKH